MQNKDKGSLICFSLYKPSQCHCEVQLTETGLTIEYGTYVEYNNFSKCEKLCFRFYIYFDKQMRLKLKNRFVIQG